MSTPRGVCSLVAAGALALTQAAQAAGPPPIVRVYVAGSAEAVSGSRAAIQDLCARSNVAVVVRDAAGADEALLATSHAPGLAEAYVDLRPGTSPRVVVIDAETRQDLERRTLADGASLEISIETIAQVVCAAVESSLAARAAPKAPAPTSSEQPKEEPGALPVQRGAHWQSHADLFASGANFGAGLRAGAGLGLAVSRRLAPVRLGAMLSVAGYPAADVEGAGGLASFSLWGARVLSSVEWRVAPAAIAFVGVGGGADWLRLSAERPPPGAVARAPDTVVDPVASGLLGVRLHLAGSVAALVALAADVDLSRHRYVVQSPAGGQSFFEPARVRPMALAGVSISLGGDDTEDRHLPVEARR